MLRNAGNDEEWKQGWGMRRNYDLYAASNELQRLLGIFINLGNHKRYISLYNWKEERGETVREDLLYV